MELRKQFGEPERRLHLSNTPTLRYKEPSEKLKRRWASVKKPSGLWYGFDTSWMEWSASEYACMLRPFIHEVIFKDESRILKVTTLEEFDAFEKRYWAKDAMFRELQELFPTIPTLEAFLPSYDLSYNRLIGSIDWPEVMQSYAACEINPYLYKRRLESAWYYGWDCASGCVWDGTAIEFKPFAVYDENKKVFVRV